MEIRVEQWSKYIHTNQTRDRGLPDLWPSAAPFFPSLYTVARMSHRDEGVLHSDITSKVSSGTLGTQAELAVSVWHASRRNLKEVLALLGPMKSLEAWPCNCRMCNRPALVVLLEA